MRAFLAVIDDQTGTATADEMAAIDDFNARLVAEGHWVLAGGLSAPDQSTLVDNRGGRGLTEPGPLFESAEYVSGFWVIDAPGIEVALELAAAASRACNRRLELRPLL